MIGVWQAWGALRTIGFTSSHSSGVVQAPLDCARQDNITSHDVSCTFIAQLIPFAILGYCMYNATAPVALFRRLMRPFSASLGHLFFIFGGFSSSRLGVEVMVSVSEMSDATDPVKNYVDGVI